MLPLPPFHPCLQTLSFFFFISLLLPPPHIQLSSLLFFSRPFLLPSSSFFSLSLFLPPRLLFGHMHFPIPSSHSFVPSYLTFPPFLIPFLLPLYTSPFCLFLLTISSNFLRHILLPISPSHLTPLPLPSSLFSPLFPFSLVRTSSVRLCPCLSLCGPLLSSYVCVFMFVCLDGVGENLCLFLCPHSGLVVSACPSVYVFKFVFVYFVSQCPFRCGLVLSLSASLCLCLSVCSLGVRVVCFTFHYVRPVSHLPTPVRCVCPCPCPSCRSVRVRSCVFICFMWD